MGRVKSSAWFNAEISPSSHIEARAWKVDTIFPMKCIHFFITVLSRLLHLVKFK